MIPKTIDILMATCNGERFLEQQVASLLRQTRDDFRLLIKDDASSDGTPALLASLARRHPEKITVLPAQPRRQGAAATYNALLGHATADYLMFCDQDDIWLKHKVGLSMARMARLEARCGRGTPILIHTDLIVAARDLKPTAHSFGRYQGLNLNSGRFRRLLLQNVATGCTLTINRALKTRVGKIPEEARMHDWWLALAASVFGVVDFIPLPTVVYRQHGGNAVGAKRLSPALVQHKLLNIRQTRADFQKTVLQAAVFLERYADAMPETHRAVCCAFASLKQASWVAKRRTLLRHGLLKHGFLRNAGMLLMI